LRYADLTIYKLAAMRHLKLSHVTSIAMLFWLPVQNITEIVQSAAELSQWRTSLILQIFIFGHLAIIEFQVCCCVNTFHRNRVIFSLNCGDLTFLRWRISDMYLE